MRSAIRSMSRPSASVSPSAPASFCATRTERSPAAIRCVAPRRMRIGRDRYRARSTATSPVTATMARSRCGNVSGTMKNIHGDRTGPAATAARAGSRRRTTATSSAPRRPRWQCRRPSASPVLDERRGLDGVAHHERAGPVHRDALIPRIERREALLAAGSPSRAQASAPSARARRCACSGGGAARSARRRTPSRGSPRAGRRAAPWRATARRGGAGRGSSRPPSRAEALHACSLARM